MTKTRILIVNNEVIAYTDDKKMLKEFIQQFQVKNYRIEKINHVPEQVEFEIQYKELYHSNDMAIIINDYLIYKAEIFISGLRDSLEDSEEWFRDFMEYVKLDGHEQDSLLHLYYHVKNLIEDLTPQDDVELLGFYYSDYMMVRDIIIEYLDGKIKIGDV